MRNFVTILATSIALASAAPALAGDMPANLKQTNAPSFGVQIASYLQGVMGPLIKVKGWRGNAVVEYDEKSDRIVVTLFGEDRKVGSAKKDLDSFRTKVLKEAIGMAMGTFRFDLGEHNFRIDYKFRRSMKLLVTFHDGKYEMK